MRAFFKSVLCAYFMFKMGAPQLPYQQPHKYYTGIEYKQETVCTYVERINWCFRGNISTAPRLSCQPLGWFKSFKRGSKAPDMAHLKIQCLLNFI